ncbi:MULTISPECIES: helix-turn-helix domain-containing protein [unclassified Mesorhizobium]|uniref:helix-turn-helix domain-containing protein n=1 Tax=unclassified Mesorhizobium TaxID=325217 RepID=UPI000FCBC4AD|nr:MULTISPECIES: helix-turn-helix domain-containing protein [unclassified Mesorhizobium]RUV23461.1 helix-turn-helix domain-containing protein [Mesorhizobium sp. M1A.F.Ca.IN.022.04.1.1]RWG29750.1 MAG: helix-turn-helix domain-containing protein [Mesorhizobium sp.]TIS16749.1 MAG: helix-turn-helix domain-containing protein [Mesorhizobium sp.]
MNTDELIAVRKALALNQTQMAEELGLKLRAYQDIENGTATLRKMHVMAAERFALSRLNELWHHDDVRKTQWFSRLYRAAKDAADQMSD